MKRGIKEHRHGDNQERKIRRRLEGREVYLRKEREQKGKLSLVGTWKSNHLNSGSMFPRI